MIGESRVNNMIGLVWKWGPPKSISSSSFSLAIFWGHIAEIKLGALEAVAQYMAIIKIDSNVDTHILIIYHIYISYIYHKSNRFQNNNLETPETPRAFPAGSGFESSSIQASKAQVNEVQQQTQTKIDVDFDTDPCKCYIKAGMTQIYPKFIPKFRCKDGKCI